jgi:hypothetical protein
MAEDDHSHIPEMVRRSGGERGDEGLVVEVPREVEIVRVAFWLLGSPSGEQEVGALAAEVGGDRLTDPARCSGDHGVDVLQSHMRSSSVAGGPSPAKGDTCSFVVRARRLRAAGPGLRAGVGGRQASA